jgi:uncharacterized protein DUF4399
MAQVYFHCFNHLHVGAGQTEAKITLPIGQRKLRLLFADFSHRPCDDRAARRLQKRPPPHSLPQLSESR